MANCSQSDIAGIHSAFDEYSKTWDASLIDGFSLEQLTQARIHAKRPDRPFARALQQRIEQLEGRRRRIADIAIGVAVGLLVGLLVGFVSARFF